MADIEARVRVALSGGATLVDVTDRTTLVTGSYGRQRALSESTTGSVVIHLADDDLLLAPAIPGAQYDSVNLVGARADVAVRVRRSPTTWSAWSTLFAGRVDTVDWQQSEHLATARLTVVDGLARLAQSDVTLTAVPAESTGARLQRLLTAAGYTDPVELDIGTVTCLSAAEWSGNALQLLRTISDTEGAQISVVYGETGDRLRFRERGGQLDERVTISDVAIGGQAEYGSQPTTIADPRLLVTETTFTDGAGVQHTEQSAAGVAAYGRHALQRTTYSSAAETQVLADWWRDIFGAPLPAIPSVTVLPHLDDQTAAERVISTTVGDGVAVTLQATGATAPVTDVYQVDGVRLRLSPLRMEQSLVELRLDWSLYPPQAIQYWTLGSSALGDTTRLSPSPVGSPDPTVPAGAYDWTTGETVTDTTLGGHVTSQVVARYATAADRDADMTPPRHGQLCVVLDELRLQLYRGGAWTTIATLPTG